KQFELVTALHDPVALFVRSGMKFVLGADGAVAAAQVGDVVEQIVFDNRHGTRHHIDVVTDRKAGDCFENVICVAGEQTNGVNRVVLGLQTHQRGIKKFGKQGDIAAIVRQGVDKIFHLL